MPAPDIETISAAQPSDLCLNRRRSDVVIRITSPAKRRSKLGAFVATQGSQQDINMGR